MTRGTVDGTVVALAAAVLATTFGVMDGGCACTTPTTITSGTIAIGAITVAHRAIVNGVLRVAQTSVCVPTITGFSPGHRLESVPQKWGILDTL